MREPVKSDELARQTEYFWKIAYSVRRAEAEGTLHPDELAEARDELDLLGLYAQSDALRLRCRQDLVQGRRAA